MKRLTAYFSILAAATIVAAATATAAPPMKGMMSDAMPTASMGGCPMLGDTVGKDITKTEFLALQAKHFDEMDTNKDGTLSADEMHAFHQKMRQDHMGAMHQMHSAPGPDAPKQH